MAAPEPRVYWPTCTGWMVRGVPRNAACSESESTRNLPSLIEEMAYMTTKNASNSVIKSPNGMAHASVLVCSSCFLWSS